MVKSPIKNWDFEDRPREKMLLKGHEVLSNAELVAILIGSGSHEESAVSLAKRILKAAESLENLGRKSIDFLMGFKGIGEAKAISICAALELGRRRQVIPQGMKVKIRSSEEAFKVLGPMLSDLPYEEFWVACLNRANLIISKEKISTGGMHGTVVDPKVIYSHALKQRASSIILYHNHPSGNMKPSKEDLFITEKLKEAGRFLEIQVLDHLIIGHGEYYSFMDEGLM